MCFCFTIDSSLVELGLDRMFPTEIVVGCDGSRPSVMGVRKLFCAVNFVLNDFDVARRDFQFLNSFSLVAAGRSA